MTEFLLEIIARLKQAASKEQIKKDIQSLGKFYVDLIGRLPKGKTQQQLKNDLKNTEIKINLSPKITKSSIQKAIKEVNAGSTKIDVKIGNGQQIKSTSNQINRLNQNVRNTDTFFGKLRNTIINTFSAGKIAMTSYLFVLNEIRKAGQNARQAIEDINKAVTDLQIATNNSRNAVEDLVKSYNEYGKNLGSTTTQITSAADDYFRAGKTLNEAQSLIKDSIMLSKLGQIDSGEATEDLLAVMNGYAMSVDEVGHALDAMTAIDLKAAASSGEIATALKYCASSADVAGVSFDRLSAMIATVKDKTQQSAETVGTFMNTLLSRFRDVKLGQFIDDDGEDLSDVESILGSLDIKLRDSREEFRNFEDIINEVAFSWNNYSSVQQAALAKAFAGTRQQNRFLALMEGYNKTLELTEVAANSAGTAVEKFQNSYMNSLEAKKNTLQASFESLVMNSDMDKIYSNIMSATTALVDFINQANLLKGVFSGLAVTGGIKAFLTIRTTINEAYIGLNKFQNALNVVKTTNISTEKFKQLLSLTNSLSVSQMRLVLSSKNLSTEQKKQLITSSALSEKEKVLLIQTYGLTTAETGLTAATTTMGNAFRALWSTLLANPLILVTTLVSGAVMAWQSYKQNIEEVRQTTKESANAYKESASSIDDYAKQYKELHEALIVAKGSEEETRRVKEQLLDLQSSLNEKFSEAHGAINLLTGDYKSCTDAIKSLNKEAAQTFLNENQKGIKQATAKMTDDNHYNLSYTGMISESDEGKILKEIAEKYKEQGISILEELDGAQFSIHLEADPQSAYDTIHDFENDVRDKARELGDEHLFDDVLEISSASLNDAKSTIDKYGDIYKQALTADIVSDNNKAKIYNEALEAVKAYNEAVMKSEDAYHDESVENARQSLKALHDEISNNEAWEKYRFLMDDIFDQADTRILDFNEALKNDSGLQKLTNDLKGLSDLDLKSLDENIGDNTSFDKLKESADGYDISVDELIDDLVRLGVVQGEITSDSAELEEPKWDFSTTLENLNKVKESMDVLDKSFAKLFDKDESIGFEDFSSIHEAFKDLEGIDDYIKRIQEAGQDTEQVSQIFSELTGAYLEHAGVLSNVTEENRELIIHMLEEMGVANAEEIVLAQLGETAETLALKKRFLVETGYELVNSTLEEVAQFLNEVDASNEAKQALAQLALEKIDLSNINFDESGNIDQLISLANAAGASAMAIAKAKQAINTINSINEKGANGSAGDFKRLDYATKTVSDIKNHAYDWQYEKLNPNDFKINSSPKYTPKYKGGSNTNKAIEQAKKDAEKEAKKSSKEAENQYEKTFDFFERRVQVLEDAFANLEKGMENVFGADAKNALVTAQIGIVDEEINNYTDALAMYRQKANEALSGVSDDLRDKIVNGAVQITDFIGDGNEEVVEAMEAYEGWADKVADCTQKLEELKTQIRQLELQKFNNIVEDFTNQFDIHGDAIDLISKQIGLLEEAGQLIGESFYTKQIEQSKKQLNTLETEKTRLVEQLNEALTSGRVEKASDEWLSMINSISHVEGNILDCKTAIEEFDNELLNLNWQIFERVQTEFGNISSELQNLAGLFDDFNEIKVSDGKGTWTKQAIATLGLYAQQYELARHQVGQYGEAIDKLNQDYAAGRYSATEYADKLADLVDGQWEAVNSAENLEDALYDLNKTRVDEEIKVIEDEIDAYKKLTDVQIKALDAVQSLHEYEQSIAEKTKTVTDIERQLAAMQNDNTSATVAKRKQLEEQLAEAKKALSEEEYQHSIETQKNALNEQYTAFEEERNKEIEALQLTLEDRETLIANSLETVKANAATVGEQIAMIAQEHGVIVSDAIISSWKSGENAIASYGEVLSAGTSAFIGNIMGVQEYVYGLQSQANSTADSLAWMFSTRADNLVNELTSSYYSEANLNAMTNTLQNSLINTLERGYNINGITSALSSIASGADSVASAANKAAQALASMGAAQSDYGSGFDTGSSKHGFRVYDSVTGKLKDTVYSDDHDYADLMKKYDSSARGIRIQKFAKGGIVSKGKDSPLDDIAKAVGEEKLIAVNSDESVLTKDQTEKLNNLAKLLDEDNLVSIKYGQGMLSIKQMEEFEKLSNALSKTGSNLLDPSQNLFHSGIQSTLTPEHVRNDRLNVNVHYDSLMTVNGDINDTKHFISQIKNIYKNCIGETFREIGRDLRYGTIR